MKVFLTGGTGFVGSEVLRQLVAAGHTVRCLVRPGSEEKLAVTEGVEIHNGDVTMANTLQGGLEGCDAVIHLVGIIRDFPTRGITFQRFHVEATRNMVSAATSQGVKRFIHMSANGSRAETSSPYHRTKWEAEEQLRGSSLDWTIFRPSLIFGAGGEFVTMLAGLVRKLPVVPVLGDGKYRMSPVAVQDVAASFVKALNDPGSFSRIYHCCGSESYSYDEILDEIGQAMGKKRVCKLHQPLVLMKPVIAMFETIPQFPITTTQLTMLLEGNVCDPQPWADYFGLQPTSFRDGVKAALPVDQK